MPYRVSLDRRESRRDCVYMAGRILTWEVFSLGVRLMKISVMLVKHRVQDPT